MGNKQSEKFFSYYHRWGEETLESSIRKCGFSADDVTDVFLTHLHFDHCGGGVIRIGEDSYKTTFKNAKYWSNKDHWEWATSPNKREVASFLKERDVAVIGCDGVSDVYPSGIESKKDALHELVLVDLGMPIFDLSLIHI